MRTVLWASVLTAALSCSAPAPRAPRLIACDHLDNVHEIAPGVLTGAGPHGEASFRELAALGVRTVISVDGSKPDLDSAKKHGLKVVHLPIGYDGIPEDRTLELAKAITELQGPVYVHCHHGKHRGPAAAAVACVAAGKLDNDGAVRVMKTMGTGEQYLGLWASARDARRAEAADLRALKVEYREVAPVPPIAEAMVDLDHAFEGIQTCRKAAWTKPKDHPDLDAAHEALRAREILTEILRTEEFAGRPADYRTRMKASLDACADLERFLRSVPRPASDVLEAAFERLRKSCSDCHQTYRNAPRKK